MPDYQVVIKPSAAKELDNLPLTIAARIAAKIESLARIPRPHGVKKLEGEPTRWRIRVSDWRVIFAIDDGRRVVDIIYIRHRSKAYE
ncbi:MAG: mRNA interferase RelE/StbE [Thermoanaerobaculia bacterium]|nr:mRNA interferase RelE/StbE [Thermoanaerobaculia bacterium]